MTKCFERTRSGDVDREEEEDAVATDVLRDSTLAGFEGPLEGRRSDDFALAFSGFLEGFGAAFCATFTDLAFKLMDLARALGLWAVFFAGLGFAFALVAMDPVTYTGYAS